jgi:hypothetical protein
VAAGHTETLTGKITLTATGTVANPIVFQKNGAGANPVLSAYTGTVATPSVVADGFFVLAGSDYVTIDGLDLQESAGNTTTTTVMEFGYGLFKASATDGCQNNVIKNCTITLNRLQNTSWTAPGYNGSTGIAILNGLYTAAGAVTVTAPSGSNSFNQILSNTVQNCNAGVVLVGFAASSPYSLADTANIVGHSASAGNTILNFGGGAATNPAAGIYATSQYGLNVSYNTVNNNNGAGVNHATTLRGIYFNPSSSGASLTCTFNNVTVKSGATASQLTGIENSFGGSTPAGNIVNLNNNTVTGEYLTATSGNFYGIYQTSSNPATLNIQNNTVQNLSYSAAGLAGSGEVYAIYSPANNASMTANITGNTVNNITRNGTTGGATIGINQSSGTAGFVVNINNNTVSNMSIAGSGTASTMYGIQVSTGTVTVNSNNVNNLQCLKTSGTSDLHGINLIGSPNNQNCNNNTVNTLQHAGTGTVNGIYAGPASVTRTISGNTIFNLSTGGVNISGIRVLQSSANVFKNKVYDIASTSTGAPNVSGISASANTSGTATIYNNLVGDLRAPSASTSSSGAPTLRGFDLGGATVTSNLNISFNTVYLNATTTGTNFGTTALFSHASSTAATGNLTLRNNIFVNLSTQKGAGFLTVAYQRNGTALNNYNAASDNNLFYAGTPSANQVIFYNGTTAQQTLANFQATVTPREVHSVTENPTFLSTSGSSADFLHISPAVATQVESGGVPVSGITDDFDANARNAATPDIGADELAGIVLDMVPPVISYVPLGNLCGSGARTLTATITDATGVPTAGAGLPVLYFSINAASGPFTASTGSSLGGNQYSFSLGTGSVPNDVVYYYVVAQDMVMPTPYVGVSPYAGASGFSATPPAVSTPPTTPNSYTNIPGLSGTYTVGAGGNYATLTAAIADYNTKCLAGPVVFNLLDASYSSGETFPLVLDAAFGASATNTLTIKPANPGTVISGTVSTGAIFKLNGADYVVFDGSTSGGSDRSLTIRNNSSATSGNAVIWLASVAAGNGATNNTIKNCIIEGNAPGTTLVGIHANGTTTISLSFSGLEKNNGNLYHNNLINKVQHGIVHFGAISSSLETGNQITNNTVGSAVAGEGLSVGGIWVANQDGTVVSGNEVQNVSGTSNSTLFGIHLRDIKNGQCFRNNVHDIVYTGGGSSSPGVYGIMVYNPAFNTAGNSSQVLVHNNFVFKINSSSTSTSWSVSGIVVSDSYGDKFYYNSVEMSGQLNNSSLGVSAAFSNGNGNLTTPGNNIDVRNNILKLSGSSAGGNIWAFYTTSTSYAGHVQNYNVLRCTGTGAANWVGRFNGTNYATLAAWQAATGADLNSYVNDPQYLSTTDLHINASVPTPAESNATPIAPILIDFDGQTRNATTPDIGADEGVFTLLLPNDMRAAAFVSPANNGEVVAGGSFSPVATFENFGSNAQTNVTVRYRIVGPSPAMTEAYNNTQIIASIASGDLANTTFASTSLAAAGTYSIYAKTELAGDGNTANDELMGTLNVLEPLSGTYNVGTGQPAPFNTLTGAVARLNLVGVSGPVVFNLTDASYTTGTGETFPIAINQFAGASAVNTFTLKPQGVTTISHSQAASSCLLRLNGADYVRLDGSTSGGTDRSLTLENTNPTNTNTACICVQSLGTGAGATNNLIKNLNLRGGSTTVVSTFGIFIGGTTVGTGNFGRDNDNLEIRNNVISRAYYGIYGEGHSTDLNDNTQILQNAIGSSAGATEQIGRYGIYLLRMNNGTISQNTIFNITGTIIHPTGIYLGTMVTNTTISRNNINNIKYTGTSGSGGKGIDITGSGTGNLTIANNFIYAISGDGGNTLSGNAIVGIRLLSPTSNLNIYYNTVVLSGSISRSAATTDKSAALYVQSGSTAVDVRNNILLNSIENTTGIAKTYAIAHDAATSPFSTINHNDYFASGPEGVLGLFNATDHATLASWQAATGQDANSKSLMPEFVSTTDLHLTGSAANLPLEGAATPLAAVTVDYDGETRDLATPDIGGDETAPLNCSGTPNPGNTIASANPVCPSASLTLSLQNATTGSDVTYLWQSSPDGVTYTDIGGANGATYTTMISANTYFRCKVTCIGSGQMTNSNPVLVNSGPVAGATASSANPVCSGVNFTLSLSGATPTGVTYQWQSSPDGVTYADVGGATNATLVTSQTTAKYYRCMVSCGAGSPTSTPLLVNLNTDACLCLNYCAAGAVETDLEKISNVLFNTINNASSSMAGYENFTGVSTQVQRGATHTFTGTISNGFASDEIIVWIDYNQDGDFADTGEEVFNSPTGAGPHTGHVTIPATATLGSTRMRVRLHDISDGPNATPCGNSTYGQVEDYCVTILQGCTTNTWTGAGDGVNWSDGGNWSDGLVPLSCQDVVIPAAANVTVGAGYTAVGKTLDVASGAVVTVVLTGVLAIQN